MGQGNGPVIGQIYRGRTGIIKSARINLLYLHSGQLLLTNLNFADIR